MEDFGKIAYEGFMASCGGRSVWDNRPMPAWEEQSPEVQAHWGAASQAVLAAWNGER